MGSVSTGFKRSLQHLVYLTLLEQLEPESAGGERVQLSGRQGFTKYRVRLDPGAPAPPRPRDIPSTFEFNHWNS